MLGYDTVTNSSGKLILTHGGRYVANTIGFKAGAVAASPYLLAIGVAWLAYCWYTSEDS